MAAPTLVNQLDPAIRLRLTWQGMVAEGVEENHPAIMRFEQFKRIYRDQPWDNYKRRLYASMSVAATKARRTLARNAALAAYYARRKELRDAYLSMRMPLAQLEQMLDGARPLGPIKASAKPVEAASIVLTREQEQAREQQVMRKLAAGPAPRLEKFCADRGEPVYAPRERLPAAINQRRDWALLQRNYREAVAFVKEEELARSRQAAALEAAGMAVSGEDSAPKVMRGAAFQRLPPAERVLHDLLLLAHQGREIPRASVHAQGGVPLFKRAGLR